jgi:hypothetical protein
MLGAFSPAQVDDVFNSLLYVIICAMGCPAHAASKMVEQMPPLDASKKKGFIHKLLESQELSRIGQIGMICSSKLISQSADSHWDIKPISCARKQIDASRKAITCLREFPQEFRIEYPSLNTLAWEAFIAKMERDLDSYERHVQDVERGSVPGIMGASKEAFDKDQLDGCNAIGINVLASYLAATVRDGKLSKFSLFLQDGTAESVEASVKLCREGVGQELPAGYVAVPTDLVPYFTGKSLRPLAKLLCEGSQKKSQGSDQDKEKATGGQQNSKSLQQSSQTALPTPVVIAQANQQGARPLAVK